MRPSRTLALLLIAGSLFTWNRLASQDAPVPAREAPLRMKLPDGFRATLFAGEPDVVQPIAFDFDDRGRLWVAECFSYPNWTGDPKTGKDRVLIFEDTNGDGTFDQRTVFRDRLANLSGIQLGFGGVWLCATPNLLFVPDRDGDDVPDGPPEVVLDGWDLKAKHNVFNGLTWGPDGWLYGCNGIMAKALVGSPGTPADRRTSMNCGVWRYHPTRKTFEVVAHGTTNPWGLDFDDFGQAFITNCVIHHLWHVVPGARFQRMYGQDANPHSYGLMESVADHIHWAGGAWTSSRGGQGAHGDAGGGHAHSGAMIYLGDNWPAAYRNGAFLCNIHGSRINHDLLERRGSTYVARHGKDFLFANDPWFRGLALQYGPDGGVYVSDWCDTGECHNYEIAHKVTGRIYKVTYGQPKHRNEDLAKLSDRELVQRQLHPNDWHVRHARRLLQERAAAGKLDPAVKDNLRKLLAEHPDVTRKLRALWALHAVGGLDAPLLRTLLDRPEEHVRAWAIQLGLEGPSPAADFVQRLAELAQSDPSPLVRLYLASGLQRLPLERRWPIAERLVAHHEDAQDLYLPLMIWYGIEPLVPADPARAQALLARTRLPLLREYLTRRLVSLGIDRPSFDALVRYLGQTDDPPTQRDVLRGLHEGLGGRRDAPFPPSWRDTYPALIASPLPEVRERGLSLAVLFGDERAWKLLRETALDRQQPPAARKSALQTLVFKQKAELAPLLQGLLDDPVLRADAIRGLAAFDDARTPGLLLKHYPTWNDAEKVDVIHTLTARPAFALALLDAVAEGTVPRQAVNAFTVRQLQALKQPRVTSRVEQVWGKLRPPSQEKQAQLTKFKTALKPDTLRRANLANGRALYAKHCAACHRLFDEGGAIGPELTGSQRHNLDYVLENVLDPSAIVPREYQVTILATADGRVLTGIVKRETEQAVTVQTQNELVTVPKAEIETRTQSPLSMMPEGMFNQLRAEEVRDLVGYLASPVQVPPTVSAK